MSKIGIFDSGIGGLTIVSSIKKQLPNETLVYFGDTMHLPYGDKSINLIKKYAEKITDYLINKENCNVIVIACNTASAAAYEYLRDKFKGVVPIINVIDPIIEEVVTDKNIKNLGVIGTSATINSFVYQEKLSRRAPYLKFKTLATPLLAPMIEQGFCSGNVSKQVIESYLKHPDFNEIDSLILACTHYPLIKDEINIFFKGNVKLIDSAQTLASKLKTILEKENLLSIQKNDTDIFYVSDLTESFQKTSKIFLGQNVLLVQKNIFTQNE